MNTALKIKDLLTKQLLADLWDANYFGEGDDAEAIQSTWAQVMTEFGSAAIDPSAPNSLSEERCAKALWLAIEIGTDDYFWSQYGGWKWGTRRDNEDVSKGYRTLYDLCISRDENKEFGDAFDLIGQSMQQDGEPR